MIVGDPNEIRLEGLALNALTIGNGFEGLKLPVEFLDIFPAGRHIDLANIALNSPNRLPLQCGDLLKPLFGIGHSELDLGLRKNRELTVDFAQVTHNARYD